MLTVILDDGAPHGAVVHYSVKQDPLKIYIQTSHTTEKAKPFLDGDIGKASVTVGLNDRDWLALQMRGEVRMVPADQFDEVSAFHYGQHPQAEKYKRSDTMFLEFVPTYWKYTDFNIDPPRISRSV